VSNWVKRLLRVSTVLLASVLLLELSYRFYIIEFYSPELRALNSAFSSTEKDQSNVLFLGDSFTGNVDGYVGKLRKKVPYNLVNSAVSGTGILEASFMAPSRIKRLNPKLVVYQIYLGNDFLDIRHRATSQISIIRKIYHTISDRIRVFKFLNYRLGQVRASIYNNLEGEAPNEKTEFSIDSYNPRQKMIFREEPMYLENSLGLKNGREKDFKVMVERLHLIEDLLPDECELIMLLIPHCAQVNNTYQSRMQSLGSKKGDLSSNAFYQAMGKEFSNHTIVNVLEEFQKSDKPNHRLYRENDPHLSDLGQSVLAQILNPYLTEQVDK
jgi:hypothetical protein